MNHLKQHFFTWRNFKNFWLICWYKNIVAVAVGDAPKLLYDNLHLQQSYIFCSSEKIQLIALLDPLIVNFCVLIGLNP
jgi:hypothetical protein